MKYPLSVIQALRNIIIDQAEIDKDRVLVYNQKIKLPTDTGIFVFVEYKYGKPISNRNTFTSASATGPGIETQDLNMQEHYTIGIFSRSTEALEQKERVLMAINSIYSQQVQEENSFKIFRSSPIQDVSELEASALLYRFDIDIVVHAWYQKTKAPDWYDQFDVEVRTEETTVEFTQPTT